MTSPSPSRRERASKAYERVRTEPGLARNTVMVIALIVIAAVIVGSVGSDVAGFAACLG